MVMEFANVTRQVAEDALAQHKEIWLAVDALMIKPMVAGDKYIPEKPKIDTGLTSEQEALCMRGRWLQDQVNAVFSVAHSKTRNQPSLEEAREEQTTVLSSSLVSEAQVATTESLQGSDEKSPPLARQSESLH